MAIRVKITAYIVAIAYSIALALTGLQLPSLAAKILSFLPTLLVAVFAVFDRWVWRWKLIVRLTHRPVVVGTWLGELTSFRDDGQGKEVVQPAVPVALVIAQTFTTVHLTLMTAESKSRSVAETLQRNDNHDYTIYYQYVNTPRLEHRDRSPVHAGGSRVEFADDFPQALDGEYWTSRRTRGTFHVTLAGRSLHGSFAAAVASRGGGTP